MFLTPPSLHDSKPTLAPCTTIKQYEMRIREMSRGQENPRIQKLRRLEDYLNDILHDIRDPVAFLYHLYFDQGKSIEQVFDTIKVIMGYNSIWWLHKLLSDFWWELRHKQDKTLVWINRSARNKYNTWIAKKNTETFQTSVWKILQHAVPYFDKKHYTSLRFPIEKVLYILWLTVEDVLKIHTETGLWKNALSTLINTRVASEIVQKKIPINQVPQILPWSIWNILKKTKGQ